MAGLALGAPSVTLANPAPVAAQVETTAATAAPAADPDATDYARREAQDTQVASYQGGSTVVIAMSGGALVVLLILLLIL